MCNIIDINSKYKNTGNSREEWEKQNKLFTLSNTLELSRALSMVVSYAMKNPDGVLDEDEAIELGGLCVKIDDHLQSKINKIFEW